MAREDTELTTSGEHVLVRASRLSSTLRRVLLVVLVLSAAAAFFVQPRVVTAVREQELSTGWLVVTPSLFSLVVVVVVLDMWRLARRRGHFRGPSVVALAACVAFLGLLLPDTWAEYQARTGPGVGAGEHDRDLLRSRDPRVRALVVELAGFRPGPHADYAEVLLRGLDDPDPLVVRTAVAAVGQRAGTYLVGPDAAARARATVESWRAAR